MLFGRRETGTTTDPAAGDEELAGLLRRGRLDLATVVELIDSRPKGSETRAHAVHVIGTDPRIDDALATAERDIDTSSTTSLLAAVRAHNIAWDARGRAVTSMTSEGQFDQFHEQLEAAELRLQVLAEERVDDDVPLWYLLSCARGLRRDPEVVENLLGALVSIAPDHRRGHTHALRYVAPKWYGSIQAMVDFAWSCSEHRSGGSPLHGLVGEALVEAAFSFVGSGPPDAPAMEAFWADQRTHDQLQIAYKSFTTGADDLAAPYRVRDLNIFVMAATQTGCVDEGRHALELLDGRVSDYPWRYVADDPAEPFTAYAERLTR